MRILSRSLTLTIVVALGVASLALASSAGTVAPAPLALNPNPPASPVRLVFVHHSTGENWLADDSGTLGIALRDNNYFVSDTNYGWAVGGNIIGDRTDIGNWWEWFRADDRDAISNALFAESGDNSSGRYSRMGGSPPAGENQIVMLKSCFPNSNLGGSPSDPATTGENHLRGQDAYSEHHTVGNAKGIYNDILEYFATRQDKLFVVITAPPLMASDTSTEAAANARALNTWLVNDWLTGYGHHNVVVFDFYTVLTSNAGNPESSDLGSASGNHHRYRNGSIEHITNQGGNMSAYPSGDSHPTPAGGLKASGEYLPLLNIFYHCWAGSGSCPGQTAGCSVACSATVPTTAQAGAAVALASQATASNCSGSVTYDWDFGDGSSHGSSQNASHTYAAGTYTWRFTASAGGQTCPRTGQIVVSEQPGGDAYAYVVPSVAHSTGMANTNWRSDVAAVNWSGDSATISLTFYDYTTGAASTASRTLLAGGTVEWKDILNGVFGFPSSSSVKGTLLVSANRALAVSSRTYNQETSTRTFGQYYPALVVDYPGGHAEDSIGYGQTGIIPGLKKNASFRTNIGMANLTQTACTASVQLVEGSGVPVGSSRQITAAGRRWKQEDDIFVSAGAGNQSIAYARITISTPGCIAWFYASVVDVATGDPTTIPVLLP